jgi:hypothetical protein
MSNTAQRYRVREHYVDTYYVASGDMTYLVVDTERQNIVSPDPEDLETATWRAQELNAGRLVNPWA